MAREQLNLRVATAEKEQWEREAERAGLTLSEYVRRRVEGTVERPPETLFGVVQPEEERDEQQHRA